MAGAPAALAAAVIVRAIRRPAGPVDRSRISPALLVWLIPAIAIAATAITTENATLANVRYRIPMAPASAAVLAAIVLRFAGPRIECSMRSMIAGYRLEEI